MNKLKAILSRIKSIKTKSTKHPITKRNKAMNKLATPKLTTSQAEVIAIFNENPSKPFNAFELRDNGIAAPAARISELIAKGAIFEKKRVAVTDASGKVHKRVIAYLFRGWT
jgi:hypothetical protein